MMTPEEYYMEVFGEEPPKRFEESEAKHHFDFCREYAKVYHDQQINLSLGDVMDKLPDTDFHCMECGHGIHDGICPNCNK